PSMLREIILHVRELPSPPALSALRWLIVTGEAFPPGLAWQWFELYPRIPLLNAYGPTECSDDVTHHVVNASDQRVRVPVGRPVINTHIYILDENLEPVPGGVTAELYVGGAGVGRGYVSDPVKTAQSFLPDPFSKTGGARIYRTGDLARLFADGTVDVLGR